MASLRSWRTSASHVTVAEASASEAATAPGATPATLRWDPGLAIVDLVVLLAVVAGLAPTAAPASAAETAASGAAAATANGAPPPSVSCIRAALDMGARRARHVRGLVALLADDDVELDDFAVADRPHGLLWIVLDDGGLVHEDVLLGVVAVDEAVAALDVEPLHRADDLGGDDLLGRLVTAPGVPSLVAAVGVVLVGAVAAVHLDVVDGLVS